MSTYTTQQDSVASSQHIHNIYTCSYIKLTHSLPLLFDKVSKGTPSSTSILLLSVSSYIYPDGATPVWVCTFGTDWFNLLGFLSLLHSTLHIHLLYLRPYLHNMVMIQNSFTEYPLAIPHRSNCASHVSDLLLYHFLCL